MSERLKCNVVLTVYHVACQFHGTLGLHALVLGKWDTVGYKKRKSLQNSVLIQEFIQNQCRGYNESSMYSIFYRVALCYNKTVASICYNHPCNRMYYK